MRLWPFRHAVKGVGARGEKLARRHLKRQGMKILAENYRCPVGEADLIALDPGTRKVLGAESLVFVEVKTRRRDDYTSPASAVNAEKQRRIRKIAEYYCSSRPTDRYCIRYDIVSIVLPDGGEPRIEHLPDAF